MAIIKIRNAAIDLDAAEIPNLDASKITSGSLADSRIPNLATSKITSGTFADARIASSNVSQHVTAFDDNKLVNDISTLALRQSSNENKAAYNTQSMYVDVFQDASGINLTNAYRDSGEFINTVSETIGNSNSNRDSYLNDSARIAIGMSSQYGTMPGLLFDGNISRSHGSEGMIFWGGTATSPEPSSGIPQFTTKTYNKSNNGTNTHYACFLDFMGNSGSPLALINGSTIDWYSYQTTGRINGHYWVYQDTSGTWHQMLGTGNGGTSGTWTSGNILNASNSDGWNGITYTGSSIGVNALALITTSHQSGNLYPGITEFSVEMADYTLSANATGSIESNAITASSSTSKMGAIITYQDNAGTNTLNTDVVLKLSADGGSNYATATLTAMPDFATGIKMAKVNDLSVTAGTSLKYKLEFANQASGSKEARIRGVSLQY